MIAAVDFSNGREWPFGIDKDRAAKALRTLADEIEKQATIVSKVSVTSVAEPTDFPVVTLTLTLHEK